MKMIAWSLLAVSVLCFVLGVAARYVETITIFGQPPITYWRGAMALALYAVALKILGTGAETAS
jgi:hypothetical protein